MVVRLSVRDVVVHLALAYFDVDDPSDHDDDENAEDDQSYDPATRDSCASAAADAAA